MRSFSPKRQQSGRTFQAPEKRESASKRGYDREWKNLRDRYIRQNPVCEYCKRNEAREVDHKEPFDGLNDPKRLQWRNLKSACRSCHARKTYRDKRQ